MELAAHSSVLAWRIPGTGNLVGCRLWGRTESDRTEAAAPEMLVICGIVYATAAGSPAVPALRHTC